jgi:hypothetical protein
VGVEEVCDDLGSAALEAQGAAEEAAAVVV